MSWELSRNPSVSVMTPSGSLSPLDLRLMHHWSIAATSNMAVGDGALTILRLVVPQLAFENEFLLNAILGISCLHLQQVVPTPALIQAQTNRYRAETLRGFRDVLMQFTAEPARTAKYEAALIMSVLLVLLYAKGCDFDEDEIAVLQWLVLYQGLGAIIAMRPKPQYFSGLAVEPFFRRQLKDLRSQPLVPRILLNMLQEVTPFDSDFDKLQDYCTVLDSIGLLYATLSEDGLSDNLSLRVITWPSYATLGFTDSVKAKQPRALIILAYYLVFLKLVRTIWWVEGIADRDIAIISRTVGVEWLPFMEIPLQVIYMTDDEEIAKLMLT